MMFNVVNFPDILGRADALLIAAYGKGIESDLSSNPEIP